MDHDKSSNSESPNTAVEEVPWWSWFGVDVAAGVILFVIVGGIALFNVPDLLLADWFPDLTSEQRAAFLGPATTAVLFALGGTIALIGVGLSISRHRQEIKASARDLERLYDDRERERARRDEVDAQRSVDTERALRERFVTTVKLLSDPAPVNRQAALFALGALADDWDAFGKPDEVQVCIEVLTGYLRAPRSDEMLVPLPQEGVTSSSPPDRRGAHHTTPQEIAVKQAGYTVIDRHLREDATPHWRDRTINLAGAHIDFDVDLNGATITNNGTVNLDNATVTNNGTVNLGKATVTNNGTVSLYDATITNDGTVTLENATITHNATVSLWGATITHRATVNLNRATIAHGGRVTIDGATIADIGYVSLRDATVAHGGYVSFDEATIAQSGYVDFDGITVADGGAVTVYGAPIEDGGGVVLHRVTVAEGGKMSFYGAMLADNVSANIRVADVSGGGSVTLHDGTLNPPAGWRTPLA